MKVIVTVVLLVFLCFTATGIVVSGTLGIKDCSDLHCC